MIRQELNLNLNDIANAIPGSFFIYRADEDKELTYVNGELLRLYQCDTLEEFYLLTQGSFRGMVHPDDLESTEKSISEQIRSNNRDMDYVEYRIVCRDGSIRWVENFGHLVHDPQHGDLFYVFVSEITETKQQLRDAKDLARVIRDTYKKTIIADAHCYFEANITQNRLDENALHTYSGKNIPLIEVLGMPEGHLYSEYIHAWAEKMMVESADQERFLYHASPENLTRLYESGVTTDSLRFWTRNVLGETMYVHQHYEIARDRNTGDIHVLSVVWDETPEKKQQELMELALARAEAADDAKSRFLASVSHNLRTPLNVILGYASMAQTKPGQADVLMEYHEQILAAGKHLLSLLNDALDMQNIESGRMKLEAAEVNMADILHEVRSIMLSEMREKGLEFYIDASHIKDQYVICDRKRITQILLNLLSNAVKFTPQGGVVALNLREIPGTLPDRPEYEFSVQDTGIGIEPDFLQRAFEPFEREGRGVSKDDGIGLGLSITKSIVELMGGSIRLQSRKEQGTTATVLLPMRKIDIPNITFDEDELKNRHVLVIDDDYRVCDSVTEMLIKLGARADWSMSGRESLMRARLAARHDDPFELYIVDWQIPDMDGIKIAKQLHELAGDRVPVVMLTAYDWSEIEEEAKEAGIIGFLEKPLFETDLKLGLHKVLDGIP